MGYLENLWNALDFGSLRDMVLRLVSVFLCLTVHETCHGLAALALGDPTAKRARRLSLNPLRHIDWFGLLMMITVGFGWAKPVPVDPRYFRRPKQGMALTALAGPVSNFLLALVLLLLFTVQLPIFPIGFSVPVGMAADEVSLADRLYHAFLPACTLGLTGISSIAMHTREKVIEILESDYVLYARARGESGWRLIFRHGLRNLLLPVITLQFGSISEIFGGSVLVEQVFSYPGLGQAAVTAGLGSDIPLLLGITLISAVLVFAGNAAADGLYRLVGHSGEPCIKGKEAGHEKENTLAAGNFPPFPDFGDGAWNRLGGCRTAGRFCEKKPASGNRRAVWNRLDGAGYAETDGCRAFFKHPAGASDRGDQRRGGIGACIAGVAWRGTDGFIGMRAD